jgi:hypothetical protein
MLDELSPCVLLHNIIPNDSGVDGDGIADDYVFGE